MTANINEYIDSILPSIREFLKENGFEPMPIPDLCEGFSVVWLFKYFFITSYITQILKYSLFQKPLFITYHGELELTKGKLTGLTSIARAGDFTVSYINKLLRIKGDFGFKNIGVYIVFNVKSLKLRNILLTISILAVHLQLFS